MKPRVLIVDDEPRVLQGLERNLRRDFDLHLFDKPEEALAELKARPQVAAIISDMRMPGMNGVQLLAVARRLAPHAVRVMLTGNTDQQTAVLAVNSGEVFKFLTKPCEPERLRQVLDEAVQLNRYTLAERELLERTLKGSVKLLTDVLAMAQPEVFGRAARLRLVADTLAEAFPDAVRWQIDTAALLSQLGCLHVPAPLLAKALHGTAMTPVELREYHAHAQIGADLIRNIPRLADVADMVLYQHKAFDGSGFPLSGPTGKELPLGARILHVTLAYDDLRAQGWSDPAIVEELARNGRLYDPDVLQALAQHVARQAGESRLRVTPLELRDGMVLMEDVRDSSGKLLVCRGLEVTPQVRRFLARFHEEGRLVEDILVGDTTQSAPPAGAAVPLPAAAA